MRAARSRRCRPQGFAQVARERYCCGGGLVESGGGVDWSCGAVVPGSLSGGASPGGGIVGCSAGGGVSVGVVEVPCCLAHAEASSNAVTLKKKTLRFIKFTSLVPSRLRLRLRAVAGPTGSTELTPARSARSGVAVRHQSCAIAPRTGIHSQHRRSGQHSLCPPVLRGGKRERGALLSSRTNRDRGGNACDQRSDHGLGQMPAACRSLE